MRDITSAELGLWAQLHWDLTAEERVDFQRRYNISSGGGGAPASAAAPSGPPFHPTVACDSEAYPCSTANCSRCREVSAGWWAFARAMTDQSMACAARRVARYWEHHHQHRMKNEDPQGGVFMFSFDHAPTGSWNEGCINGDGLLRLAGEINPGTNHSADICAPWRMPLVNSFAHHADDIPFWFAARPMLDTTCVAFEGERRSDCPAANYDKEGQELARQMSEMWSTFARTGVPSARSGGGGGELVWPKWEMATQKVLHLATEREGGLRTQPMEKSVECVFWDKWEALDVI